MKSKTKLVIAVFIAFSMLLISSCQNKCKKPCECKAEVQSVFSIFDGEPSSFITVPANAGILQIVASVVDSVANPAYAAVITGDAGIDYQHAFKVSSVNREGNYEITFAKPVCVGEEDATFRIIAVNSDNTVATPVYLSLTIVYCPDFCLEDS